MIKTISQIFTQDTFKLLTLFSLSPGSRFNRKELKEKTLLNNVPLDKAVTRLVSSGLIKKEHAYYSLNFENDYIRLFITFCAKQHKQLKRLPLKIYFLITDLVMQISPFKGVELYLFGSYSKLIFIEKSDVDVAILMLQNAKKDVLSSIVEKISKAYHKEIQPHFFDKKSFYSNKRDPLVKEILRNGVRLV